jgi:hypothetical protein
MYPCWGEWWCCIEDTVPRLILCSIMAYLSIYSRQMSLMLLQPVVGQVSSPSNINMVTFTSLVPSVSGFSLLIVRSGVLRQWEYWCFSFINIHESLYMMYDKSGIRVDFISPVGCYHFSLCSLLNGFEGLHNIKRKVRLHLLLILFMNLLKL